MFCCAVPAPARTRGCVRAAAGISHETSTAVVDGETSEEAIAMANKTRGAEASHTTANPAYAQAIAELRRSGAAGTHGDKRDKRSRTRGAKLRRALTEQQHETSRRSAS